jgi:hypothetical protein
MSHMVVHFSIHGFWDNAKKEAPLALSFVRVTSEGLFYFLHTWIDAAATWCAVPGRF